MVLPQWTLLGQGQGDAQLPSTWVAGNTLMSSADTGIGNQASLVQSATSDAAGANTSMTYQIPNGTNGRFTVYIEGRQASYDGGHELAGDSVWSCGVTNNAGTCQVYRACAATNAWVAADGGNTWTTSVAIAHVGDGGTGCQATLTVTGAAGAGAIHWASTASFASAK